MDTTATALRSEKASLRFLSKILLDFATVILSEVRNAPVNDSTASAYLVRVRFVNIALNLNTILEMTEDSSLDSPFCTTFNHVRSEFLLLCENLISDDVLKNKRYHGKIGAKRNLDNNDNLTKLLFLDSCRPKQVTSDIEEEEDIIVGEHWLPYLDVGEILYGDGEFQRQLQRLEAIVNEQIILSTPKRAPKSHRAACKEIGKRRVSDGQEVEDVNPDGASFPLNDMVKNRGVPDIEDPPPKIQPSNHHNPLAKSLHIERGPGQHSILASALHSIKSGFRLHSHRGETKAMWKRLELPKRKATTWSRSKDHISGLKSDDHQEFASSFFSLHEEFLERHIQPRSSGSYGSEPRVKVAILDTGIDMFDPHIAGGCRGKRDPIKVVKHFGGSEREIDLNGHGTHIAGLVMKIAHHADLYIAKVADNTPQGERGYSSVVDALAWAIENEVDIVTMSFGFMEQKFRYTRLKAEIRRAQEKDIILFAAAPNTDGHEIKAYPASDCNVLCIHAVDRRGGNFGGSKPSVGRKHNHFATLGTGIQRVWDEQRCVKGGNSYANAIAAGFAANVLEYALLQVKKQRLNSEVHSNLRHLNGMRIMFGLMAKQDEGEQGQGFVRPWTFWTSNASPERMCERLEEQLGHFPPL